MDDFLNALKAQAAGMEQRIGQPRFGVVSSVDPARATARVVLQPEGVLSGWLPVLSPWIGAGWGMVCPPSPGDQVLVLWQEGEAEHGVIVGRAFSDTQAAPKAASGELWLVHKSGTYVKLRNDGSIASGGGGWTHDGDLHVTGNVFDHHGSLDALRGHYNGHSHGSGGVTPQD